MLPGIGRVSSAQGSFVDARLVSSSNLSKEPADLLIIRNSQTVCPLVIRSAQELAAVSHRPPNTDEAAAVTDDVNLEMEVEQRLLTLLELAEIDWEKPAIAVVERFDGKVAFTGQSAE